MTALLSVQNLSVAYGDNGVWNRVVHDVSFTVAPGEVLGLVGESGSGKSTVAFHVLGYGTANSRTEAGQVLFDGLDVLRLGRAAMRRLRGSRIGFVPQNPTTALSPAMRIGSQLEETIRAHRSLPAGVPMAARIESLLDQVGLPTPAVLARRYPHELSGGQQQRVCIALALASGPELLVLDEPTTGLDVTVQRQIVALLGALRARLGMAMVYVTHDLALLAQIADRIGVMQHGRLVEIGPSANILLRPSDSYTRKLVGSIPDVSHALRATSLLSSENTVEVGPLLELQGVELHYGWRNLRQWLAGTRPLPTASAIDLQIAPGEVVALVGESGSGKSTIARAISGRLPPSAGAMLFEGRTLPAAVHKRSRPTLRAIQYVFQNPDASLNPRRRVRAILDRVLRHFELTMPSAGLDGMLGEVRLPPHYLSRFPSQLSGGERQRVAIARALAAGPKLLICDEVLSALDLSVQAAVLDTLRALRAQTSVALLFISHDLGVVGSFADRIVVLYRGEIMQAGSVAEVFGGMRHPYSAMLLDAAPTLDRDGYVPPRPAAPSSAPPSGTGCAFAGRCPSQLGVLCVEERPPRHATATGFVACHISPNKLGTFRRAQGQAPNPVVR